MLSWVEVTVCGHCLVTVCGRSLQAHIGMGIRPTLSWPIVATAYYFPTHPPPFSFSFLFTVLGGSHGGTQICSCKRVLSGPFCFMSTEARWIRVGDREVGGGGGRGEERMKARPRIPPEKDRRDRPWTAARRMEVSVAKAVSPRHCPANSALRNCCFNCRA